MEFIGGIRLDIKEYYKLIRNSVQLIDVNLVKMTCINNTRVYQDESEEEKSHHVHLAFKRSVTILSENTAEISLFSKIGVEDGPFDFEIEYRGICITTIEIDKDSFEQYSYNQVVPLLIPYVRECVASTMAKMGLPIFTIPTMDVLDSIEENLDFEQLEE